MSSRGVEEAELELDLGRYELRRGGHSLRLERQPMELLILLVENQGQLVGREQIVARLWDDSTFLDTERSINSAIRKIRLVLHDDPDDPRYLQTVIGKGYRFVGAIHVIPREHVPPRPPSNSEEIVTEKSPEAVAVPQSPSPKTWRRPILASCLILAIASSLWMARNRFGLQSRPTRIQSLAVLPLENLSGDPAQDYFADEMTDELVTDLAGVKSLSVISRTSVMQYKGTRKPLSQIGRELKVDAIVEGSVSRSGDRVRITAQLIQAETDHHLWAQSFERDFRDILSLQRDVAQNIASRVQAVLTPEEQARLARVQPVNPEAYEAYLKGRYFYNRRTEVAIGKAEQYFKEAIEKDPTYAPAYSGLADCANGLGWYEYLPPADAAFSAKNAARKALELDDSLAEAHASLANPLYYFDWDWKAAEAQYKRAMELNPRYVNAPHWHADYLSAMGRNAEAIAEARRAQQLDPLALIVNTWLARRLYFAREYQQAIDQAQKTLEIDPSFIPAHLHLGLAYEQKAMYKDAIVEFQKAVDLSTRSPIYVATLAHAYAVAGQKAESQKLLAELKEDSQKRYVSPYQVAEIYAGLGDKQQALGWLERAYKERAEWMVYLKVDPGFDSLHSEPRYQQLVCAIGFPQCSGAARNVQQGSILASARTEVPAR